MAKDLPEAGPGQPPLHKTSFYLYLFFAPCFLLLIFILLIIMQYKNLHALVAATPASLPYVKESRSSQDSVLSEIRAFFGGGTRDTLSLSAVQLNHLIQASPVLKNLGWKYHLVLEDTLFVAKTSLPAQQMKGPAGTLIRILRVKGYLNSEISGYPQLQDGRLNLIPVRATMNGVVAPGSALTKQGDLNPRNWLGDPVNFDSAIAKLAGIHIHAGKLLLIKKS